MLQILGWNSLNHQPAQPANHQWANDFEYFFAAILGKANRSYVYKQYIPQCKGISYLQNKP